MPGHPRLYRRGAVYYHRAAVPVDIKDTYPKAEETFSLKTTDYQEAVKLVRVAAAQVDRRFNQHRRKLALAQEPPVGELPDETIKQLGEMYHAALLRGDEAARLRGFEVDEWPPIFLNPLLIPVGTTPGDAGSAKRDALEVQESIIGWLDGLARHDHARGKVGDFFMGEAEEILTREGVNIHLAPGSPSLVKLARELQAATIKAHKAIRERNKGEVVETPKVVVAPTYVAVPLLSEVVAEWITDKTHGDKPAWVPKTAHEQRAWMDHFITLAGDKPFTDYGKADARAFKALLLKLPANWAQLPDLKGLSVVGAAERAAELDLKTLSSRTINKIMRYVGSLWSWADGHYDTCPPDPFRKMKISASTRASDERHPFTLDELRAIFAAPLFTGCQSIHRWKEPGPTLLRDAGVFWVPLIDLFTGARAGEVIQLTTADIQEQHGVLFFSISARPEGQGLKSKPSRRSIPIHRELLSIGFMEFVEARRSQGSPRLFPDLKRGEDGYFSSPFSKHFGRFLKSIGVKHEKNAFHSFRHSFEDACIASGIPGEYVDALQGHTAPGMRARYGSGGVPPLALLAEAMEKMEYEGLDLSHLYPVPALDHHPDPGQV